MSGVSFWRKKRGHVWHECRELCEYTTDGPIVGVLSKCEREDLLAHGDVVLVGTEFMAGLYDELTALRERVKTLEPYARFGSKAFEFFWHDAEPGDVDASDAQEMAVQAGLLRRRAPEDIGLSCCEYCDWQPGQPVEECSCLFPTLAPLKGADQ